MFMDAKFIAYESFSGSGVPTAIIFGFSDIHSDMARLLWKDSKILGAGFVRIVDGKPVVFGESVSLKVKANEAVTQRIINQLFNIRDNS